MILYKDCVYGVRVSVEPNNYGSLNLSEWLLRIDFHKESRQRASDAQLFILHRTNVVISMNRNFSVGLEAIRPAKIHPLPFRKFCNNLYRQV